MRARPALLLFAAGLCLAAKPFPKPPVDYVHNEGVISPVAEQVLSRELAGFESRTGHQFVVALFKGLEGESLEDWTNRLFRAWKIGDAKRNDGLLFALFKDDRKWRVEVGYGFEGTLTDLEAAEIVRARARPLFKRGDYDSGVLAGVRDLEAKLGGAPQAPPAPFVAPDAGPAPRSWFLGGMIALCLFVLVLAVLASATGVQSGPATLGRRAPVFEQDGSLNLGGSGRFLLQVLLEFLRLFLYISLAGRGGGGSGGGFSGGGGSSGGGGASGGW